jgi:uncharacterized repeat protein (TIGR01451 family)
MKKLLLLLILLCVFAAKTQAQCFANGFPNNATCGSVCSGSIFIQFGTPAYPVTVYVNGGPPISVTTAFNMGNLCPGIYNVLAVDANGDTCTGVNTFMILQNPPPIVTLSSTNSTCQGCNDGTIIAQVTGGSAPYTYLWSDGSTTPVIANASAGVYCITVTDANGCSVTDCATIANGSNGFYALQGDIYLDLNSNGVRDVGEVGLQNQSVNLSPLGTTSLTNSNGHYICIVPPGTYDVAYNSMFGWNLTSSPSVYNEIVDTLNIDSLDFGVYPDSTAAAATVTLTSGFPRCLWNVGYVVHVNNTGFTTLSGTVELSYDPALTFVNATPVPVSHIGNVLSFAFTNLPPSSVGNFNLQFTEPAGGTVLSSTVIMNAGDSFGNQVTQSTTLPQIVSCSFDPNDKQVLPIGIGPLNYVAMDEWLTYQIRFQNTGTDTAFKVVILDTLDTNLDMNSFMVVGSSHTVNTTIQPSREVSFTFENILLPDSNVNEPGSHGYVIYRIKGLQSNPDPTTVDNTAYIYFDLNSPVITNTTLTTFSDNFLGIYEPGESNNFEIFPNPMTHSATVRLKNQSNDDYFISVYDITGRNVISSRQMQNGVLTLYKGDLKAGVYILEAQPVNDGAVEKLRLIVK